MTPLVVSKRGKQTLNFYTDSEFKEWYAKITPSSWQIEYKKGLASLTDSEYSVIIKDPFLIKIELDKLANTTLDEWFGKDSTPRKKKLLFG
jgi:hypothetical protein